VARQFSIGTKFGSEKGKVQNPARIPPRDLAPAGGKKAEAGQFHSPRQIVSPCLVRISGFNHLHFARNSFELRPKNTAHKKSLNVQKTPLEPAKVEKGRKALLSWDFLLTGAVYLVNIFARYCCEKYLTS
jgi:hypothetical protein